MTFMNGVGLGLALARERLRGVSALLVLALGCGAVFALGVLSRRSDADAAADNTLYGAVFGIALPVLAYLVSERVCAGQQLARSVDGIARYGTDRRAALVGLLLGCALCTALASALLTIVGLLAAHSPQQTGLALDLRASVAIALLAGVVYALWFGAASLFGKRGGGRKWALILDFLLGAGSSALAAPWPRAELRNLLGGEPALDWSQASAWLALAVIGALSLLLCVARTAE